MKRLRKYMPRRKRSWVLWILTGFFAFLLVSCGPVKLTLAQASMKPKGMLATPALLSAHTTLEEWNTSIAPDLKRDIQEHIYGYMPDETLSAVIDRKLISTDAFAGKGRVEEITVQGSALFGDKWASSHEFNIVVVSPSKVTEPVPVILMETFCPSHSTVPVAGVSRPDGDGSSCDGGGIMGGLMTYVFGRYIATPPFEDILDHGYAVATVYASEIVPDRSQSGLLALSELSPGHSDDETRWGAIAAWAWGYSLMVDALNQKEETRYDRFVAYGHSRFGKSALVAAAFDDRIDGVISHQSGTGGASLNKLKKGESIAEITNGYPHWFSKKYAEYAKRETDMPVDQHAVLGLIAPRPVFLGNARRDVWSDPNGAFKAAIGADGVYELYDKQGLDQDNLKSFKPDSELSFYIRPGTHGVVKEDWPAFLDFMDAHFK